MKMVKFHISMVHVSQYVKHVGLWGNFGEEGFENYQHVGKHLVSEMLTIFLWVGK